MSQLSDENDYFEQYLMLFLFPVQVSNLQKVNSVWRSQLQKMILKLLSHLMKYPATEAPSFESIFGDEDPMKIAGNVVHASEQDVKLAATNDLIFYSMLSIIKLQPYANPVTYFILSRSCFFHALL